MPEPRYMSQFKTPEEFIRHEIIANRGAKNVAFREELVLHLQRITGQAEGYDGMTKEALFDRLVELKGKEAYLYFDAGVSSYDFQLKFDIDGKTVRHLAKTGLLHTVKTTSFQKYGKTLQAALYSPYDYFRLTKEDVADWLRLYPQPKYTKKERR